MKALIVAILGLLVWAIVLSVAIASLLVLDASLPAKLLIGSSLGLLGLLFYRLDILESNLLRLLSQSAYFSRVSFVAAEINRTNPSDARPARDIAMEDITRENENESIERALGTRPLETGRVVYGGFVLTTSIITYLLFLWLRAFT